MDCVIHKMNRRHRNGSQRRQVHIAVHELVKRLTRPTARRTAGQGHHGTRVRRSHWVDARTPSGPSSHPLEGYRASYGQRESLTTRESALCQQQSGTSEDYGRTVDASRDRWCDDYRSRSSIVPNQLTFGEISTWSSACIAETTGLVRATTCDRIRYLLMQQAGTEGERERRRAPEVSLPLRRAGGCAQRVQSRSHTLASTFDHKQAIIDGPCEGSTGRQRPSRSEDVPAEES